MLEGMKFAILLLDHRRPPQFAVSTLIGGF
jgi:hypothetical protein